MEIWVDLEKNSNLLDFLQLPDHNNAAVCSACRNDQDFKFKDDGSFECT